MMKQKLYTIFFVVLLGATACNNIDDPFADVVANTIQTDSDVEVIVNNEVGINSADDLANLINNNTWINNTSPDQNNRRFVTLEDFTGHRCFNCPPATKELIRLDSVYGEQLIPITIHAGTFAVPFPVSVGKYYTDFRVDDNHGQLYDDKFNDIQYPKGLVSRNGIIPNPLRFPDWESNILSLKDLSPLAEVNLINNYSESENVVRTRVDVIWNHDSTINYALQLIVKEDSIIDWQKDGNVDIEFYNHRHVLRKVVNDTYGTDLTNAVNGDTLKYEYIFKVKPEWRPNHSSVVAFVFHKDDASNRYEIIQANEVKIK